MSRFLKLTGCIINKNVIHHIDISDSTKFILYLTHPHIFPGKKDGNIIFNYVVDMEICENCSDYKTIADWIDNELK